MSRKMHSFNEIFADEVWNHEHQMSNESPAIYQFKPSLYSGVNGKYGTFLFRLGYFMWIMKGSNTLKSINYYGDYLDSLTDDGNTLRGAYGPRMRMWIGPDALQEAININKDIDNPEEFVKPCGTDQFRSVCEDLMFGMTGTAINIFDPSLDFGETNNVPELQRVEFIMRDNKLNLVMNFMSENINAQTVSDIWVFGVLQGIIASFMENASVGGITLILSNKQGNVLDGESGINKDMSEIASNLSAQTGLDFEKTKADDFLGDFSVLRNFELHIRMQICKDTFNNAEVSIPAIIETFNEVVLKKITNKFVKELGICLLLCAIFKYGTDLNKYKSAIFEIAYEMDNKHLLLELYGYAVYELKDSDFLIDLRHVCLSR